MSNSQDQGVWQIPSSRSEGQEQSHPYPMTLHRSRPLGLWSLPVSQDTCSLPSTRRLPLSVSNQICPFPLPVPVMVPHPPPPSLNLPPAPQPLLFSPHLLHSVPRGIHLLPAIASTSSSLPPTHPLHPFKITALLIPLTSQEPLPAPSLEPMAPWRKNTF